MKSGWTADSHAVTAQKESISYGGSEELYALRQQVGSGPSLACPLKKKDMYFRFSLFINTTVLCLIRRETFSLSSKFFLAISYKYVIVLPQSHPRKYIHVIGPASWHYRVRQLRLCWYMVGQDCNLQPLEVAVYVSSLVLGQDAFVSDLVGEEVHMKANSVKSIVIELLFPL